MTPEKIINKFKADLLKATGMEWKILASPILPKVALTIDHTTTNEQYIKDYIVNVVCSENGLNSKDLYTKHLTRIAIYVETRFMIWRLLRERKWSLNAIGREFMRDYTTILKGVKKHDVYMSNHAVYKAVFERVLIKLNDK